MTAARRRIDYLRGRWRAAPASLGSIGMSLTAHRPGAHEVGDLLRGWRHRRRLSQLDLALGAEVSARHLSFVETGRSKPSRELLLHLAEHLDVPLRDRNALLVAAGYAPVFAETALDDSAMTPVREALDRLLAGHAPFPALVVDHRWDLLSANLPAMALMGELVAPELLEPPVNGLRVVLHPDGLAPRIENLAEYGGHLLMRLRRHELAAPDPAISALIEELSGYPGVEEPGAESAAVDPADLLFVPLRMRGPGDEPLAFFSTLATFGTALDITLAELIIEQFFPADPATEKALRTAFG
jgi:transcriptional regulator with XRE-family HTH domain